MNSTENLFKYKENKLSIRSSEKNRTGFIIFGRATRREQVRISYNLNLTYF